MGTLQEKKYAIYESKALWLRNKVLEMAVSVNSGHVSTAFSQAELLIALYNGKILNYDSKNLKWDQRDRFILSKGQGGIGIYPVLADNGFFPIKNLENFTGPGSLLGVHAEWHVPGIEVLTGSLGHGLPMATGMAQAAKNDNKKHLIFCLLGDAELYEGSNWEAATFAGHMEYDNLICIIDRNGQGVLGHTDLIESPSDGPRLNPLDDKFRSFGFEVRTINGNCFEEIFEALKDVRERKGKKPLMIIANTKKGKGSKLIEDQRLWHYRVPKGEELDQVKKDLNS